MQFMDLAAQQQRIKSAIDSGIQTVLSHGLYIMGPEIGQLEKNLAAYVGAKHAIACGSGTDALLMALMAFNIGPGDAVFTTPFTFIATAEVISLLGATPVFVDVDPVTFNLDPKRLETAIQAVEKNDPSMHPLPGTFRTEKLTPRGIIPVDLFGLPADYAKINAIAQKDQLCVIQDAAQSFGGQYQGRNACSQADIGCTSFFPAKPLGCYGDGGMCFTDRDDLANLLGSIRVHGKGTHKYDNTRIGINGRLDTLQAAILLAKLDIFSEEVILRRQVARIYTKLLSNLKDLTIPSESKEAASVWAQYSLLARDENHRSQLQQALKKANIPTAVYYPTPLHLQTAFAGLEYKAGDFPISEDLSKRIFSLPMHPYLQIEDQRRIAQVLISQCDITN